MDPHENAFNPFSTRYWTAGTWYYRFLNETDQCEHLLDIFLESPRRIMQLVGPHGSGKSTLLHSFEACLKKRGVLVHYVVLNSENRKLPYDFFKQAANEKTVTFLDGYELTSIGTRWSIRSFPWHSTSGLLLTTHRRAWRIPLLYQLQPDQEILHELILELTQTTQMRVEPELLNRLFKRHSGNFRTVFFELYDLYEKSRNES